DIERIVKPNHQPKRSRSMPDDKIRRRIPVAVFPPRTRSPRIRGALFGHHRFVDVLATFREYWPWPDRLGLATLVVFVVPRPMIGLRRARASLPPRLAARVACRLRTGGLCAERSCHQQNRYPSRGVIPGREFHSSILQAEVANLVGQAFPPDTFP